MGVAAGGYVSRTPFGRHTGRGPRLSVSRRPAVRGLLARRWTRLSEGSAASAAAACATTATNKHTNGQRMTQPLRGARRSRLGRCGRRRDKKRRRRRASSMAVSESDAARASCGRYELHDKQSSYAPRRVRRRRRKWASAPSCDAASSTRLRLRLRLSTGKTARARRLLRARLGAVY